MSQVPLPSAKIPHKPKNHFIGLAGAHLGSSSHHPATDTKTNESIRHALHLPALPFRLPLVPKRFVALLLFCWFAINNGFSWLMFAPVTHRVLQLYRPHVSLQQVELLNSWQPLIYCVVLIPMLRILSKKDGLRGAIILGAQLEVAGALLKLFSTALPHELPSVCLLHVGQMLSAISSPVAIGAPALLSASFFPPHLRTTCTGLAVVSNNIGNALSYTLAPTLTLAYGFEGVVWFETLNGLAFCILAMLFMPQQEHIEEDEAVDETESDGTSSSATTTSQCMSLQTSPNVISPPPAPSLIGITPGTQVSVASDSVLSTDGDELRSPTAMATMEADEAHRQREHENKKLRRDVGVMFCNRNVVLLMFMYAWCSGGYVAWTSLFDVMLDDKFGVLFIGTLSFMGTVGYILGGIITAVITDAFFRRRMKEVIIVCCLLNSIGCGIFALSISATDDQQAAVGGVLAGEVEVEAPPPVTVYDGLRSSGRHLLSDDTYPESSSHSKSPRLIPIYENAEAVILPENKERAKEPTVAEGLNGDVDPPARNDGPVANGTSTDTNEESLPFVGFFEHYMDFLRTYNFTLSHTKLLILVALCGFFNGSSAPIFFELVAEIAFPINEAISGNIMSMAENIGSLILYQVVARCFAPVSVNFVFTIGMATTVFFGLCVQAQYRRRQAHEAKLTYRREREEERERKFWATENSRLLDGNAGGMYGATTKSAH